MLKLQLQEWDRVIADMHASVRAFKTKLHFWEMQTLQGILGHLLCCQSTFHDTPVFCHCVFKCTFCWKTGHGLYRVHTATCRLWSPEPKFELSNSLHMEKAPTNIQMVLQLKWHMSWSMIVNTAQFPCFIPKTMPQLRLQAAQMLCMFGSTYLREQSFSVLSNKISHRSQLTDAAFPQLRIRLQTLMILQLRKNAEHLERT